MNPLDVSEVVKPLQDIPGGYPISVQGIPGVASGDAVTVAFVDVLCSEVQHADDYAWQAYEGLMSQWRSNNQAGIFRPAPGPVTLATVNRLAAAKYLNSGSGGANVISYYQKYDPDTPPGFIASPPPPDPPKPRADNPIGSKVPGTSNLYLVNGGGYTAADVGTEHTDAAGNKYVLILSNPVGGIPMWLKE